MTRSSLRRTLTRLYLFLGVVLAISLLAKFADHVPGMKGTGFEAVLKDVYEYIKDMSLLIATGGVAYISQVYQKRSSFVESLEAQWREIVDTKSALYAFCERQDTTNDDYIQAFCRISATLDTMRIVYRNLGETDELIGLYPYTPLHEMRRALQTLNPLKNGDIGPERRKLVRDAILQSFYALRENFLEELDLEAPDNPLLIHSGRRLKRPGHPAWVSVARDRQRRRQDRTPPLRPDVDQFLAELYELENGDGRHPVPERRPAPGS